VGSINGITAIDICGNQKARAVVGAENIGLVRRGVSSENGGLVRIVSVRFAASGMVLREAQRVEVLMGANDRR
jgi:hypothetical protein